MSSGASPGERGDSFPLNIHWLQPCKREGLFPQQNVLSLGIGEGEAISLQNVHWVKLWKRTLFPLKISIGLIPKEWRGSFPPNIHWLQPCKKARVLSPPKRPLAQALEKGKSLLFKMSIGLSRWKREAFTLKNIHYFKPWRKKRLFTPKISISSNYGK